MKKNLIALSIVIISLFGFFPQNAGAQKHVDLQLSVATPQHNSVVLYGDTVVVAVSVKNLGPDTLLSNQDTIYYGVVGSPINSANWANLFPGDSAIFSVLYLINNDHADDIIQSYCFFLLPGISFVDTNNTNDSSCVAFTLKGSESHTGIEYPIAADIESPLELYPNPASETINLELNLPRMEEADMSIYDIFGKPVIAKKFQFSTNQKRYLLNVSKLPSGVYWLKCSTANSHWFRKLSIVR